MKNPAVYIMTNRPNGVIYVGVTSNLTQLVWYEHHATMEYAILREKQFKGWQPCA